MTTTRPAPPSRDAHLFDAEQGASIAEAQASLLFRLSLFASSPLSFRGDAEGEIHTRHNEEGSAQLAFRCSLGAGFIDLTSDLHGWIRADISIAGEHRLRVWLDQPYEEAEFWPDGADGEGEPPGRISKRGAWLTIDCARFPGMPDAATGFWTLEETDA